MDKQIFYKIIGKNFGSFPYHLGLNKLSDNNETFNSAPDCVPGGLYFTGEEHLADFVAFGDQICTLSIPSDATVVQVDDKWKADQIYIEEIRPLWTIETFKTLPRLDRTKALQYVAGHKNLDVVRFLVEQGADIHANREFALCWAAEEGNLDVVRYLVEQGADVHVKNEFALQCAAEEGHLDVVRFLVEQGADIHAENECAVHCAADNGHVDVVQFLVKQGSDLHADDDQAFHWAKNICSLVKHGGTIVKMI